MKIRSLILILILLCPNLSFGEPAPLLFHARIQRERLAEEAIALLQCLADRAGTGWELADEAAGPHWVRMEEKGNRLVGEYQAEEKRRPFSLAGGGWRETCDQLRPGGAEPTESGSTIVAPQTASLPERAPEYGRAHSAWWWAGAAGLVIGGVFLWRQRAVRHQGIQMH